MNSDKQYFDERWCGPEEYETDREVLIADYPATNEDGQPVEVYCHPTPARFYKLVVADLLDSTGNKQDGYRVSTGSSMAALVAELAKAIAAGMIGFEPSL